MAGIVLKAVLVTDFLKIKQAICSLLIRWVTDCDVITFRIFEGSPIYIVSVAFN